MPLKNKIAAGLVITGAFTALTSISAVSSLDEQANAFFTDDVRYIHMVDKEPWQKKYREVDGLYTRLKENPEVQEAISNYDRLMEESREIVFWGVGGGGALILAGIFTFAYNKGKRKQEEKK